MISQISKQNPVEKYPLQRTPQTRHSVSAKPPSWDGTRAASPQEHHGHAKKGTIQTDGTLFRSKPHYFAFFWFSSKSHTPSMYMMPRARSYRP